MTKQRISIVLVLLMLISILPFTAFAAGGDQKGNDTSITRVDLTVPVPKVGDVFNGSQDDAGATAVGTDFHFTITQSKWYNEWGLSEPNMVFEAGAKYFVEIDLTANSGYRFDEDTVVTINGKPAKVFRQSNVTTWYACSENLTPEAAADTRITRVDLTVPVPKVGDVFNGLEDDAGAKAVGSDIHYTVKQSKWYNEWGLSDPNMVFEAGAKYFVEIDLTANSGYCFDEKTVVTINGKPAKVFRQSNVTTWYACSENLTPEAADTPFKDVPKSAYYAQPVLWAVNHKPVQITNGVGEGRFAPDATCTRGQVVTFLWRAMGSPEPKMTRCPFTDVHPSDYFYKAVLWAVENKITNGTGPTTFSPDAGCTRGQVVTFLWRAQGEPKPGSTTSPFADVKGDYYFKAVLWAVENKITTGIGNGLFAPNNTCTRGQIVTFLYRDMA